MTKPPLFLNFNKALNILSSIFLLYPNVCLRMQHWVSNKNKLKPITITYVKPLNGSSSLFSYMCFLYLNFYMTQIILFMSTPKNKKEKLIPCEPPIKMLLPSHNLSYSNTLKTLFSKDRTESHTNYTLNF